ncbi:MAG: hypothetical protein LUC90_10950 [Lachnospiraceae bacterium]|nr:hypothetical protein [Lachnospiraceae bacterium]
MARVDGNNIVYHGDDDEPEEEKAMAYIVRAYNNAFSEPSEYELLLKNGVQVEPCDILEINEFKCWD